MVDVLILGGARTPFTAWAFGRRGDGARGGALAGEHPFDLGAAAVKGALERSGVDSQRVERIVFGNVYHTDTHAWGGARYIGLRAGLPESAPALTVSMACCSGLQAVIEAAQDVRSGEARVAVGGGTDCASRYGKDEMFDSFNDRSCGREIADVVEAMARRRSIGREASDCWALESHRRFRKARDAGYFKEEIFPVGAVSEDDYFLPERREGRVRRARPTFGEDGSVTSANSHGLVDGASAVVLSTKEGVPKGRRPLGKIVSWAYSGVAPEEMGTALVPALKTALVKAQLKIADINLFEINETFASQVLMDIRELGLKRDQVNVNGGGIAIGHPFAGSGARLVHSLLLELGRRGLKRGAAAISAGGGQGAAVVVETA
ncbi:MAG: thiolase family protein [Elusimicrobiota bacterium]